MPPRTERTYCLLRRSVFALLILLLSSCFFVSYSQDEQDRKRETKPDLNATAPQDKGFRIGVNVDLVLMYTSVFDKNNHFVAGLKKEDFRLYEDGVQQEISSFSQEDVPVSMGVVIDLSGSMRSKIGQVNKAAEAFIRASNPQDQVFLIGFNDEVELLQDFTNDIDEITDALDNTIVSGGTAVYDAVYLGIQKAHAGTKPKKAIVVISDGEDADSYYKLDEVVAKVQEADVQVFCVGFLNEIREKKGLFGAFSKSVPEKAKDALTRIAEETGGKAFFPGKLTDIHTIVAEIARELRSQYSIGYFSSNQARDGSFRRVKIEIGGPGSTDKHIRYRRGYYAPKS